MLACGLAGADKWSVFRSEPFTVYTNGKDKEAREALALAVQVHHTLSAQFGKELTPSWPITYVLGKGDGKLRLGSRAELFNLFLNHLITAPVGNIQTP